ncbi:TetR/AcrR family transcriptional regulator [Nonomuraea sp. B10E15]|uniref:TetR/AcrR family transcriptional regulator n=1 Tax=Nonomuraea sp. B10E15 TaxID=3153560 RepID=UPI00325C70C2
MTSDNRARRRPPGGLADKRRAILAGALTVFARDGYTRAGIDAIAAAAGVSTRTIYNHFADKAELFQTVIKESAGRAADAQIAIIDRHLHKITDLEADLVEFGRALTAPMATEHAEHFALVRQVNAEAGHIPQAAIDAWQEIGPRRVLRRLAEHLRQWTAGGLLHADDPERAAVQLMLLISAAGPPHHAPAPSRREADQVIASGVHVFLYGYGADRLIPDESQG